MAIEKFIRTVRVYNPKIKQHQNVTVSLKLDIDSIANVLGAAAIRNRSQVARHLKGRIVCSVRDIEVPTVVAEADPFRVLRADFNKMFKPD